MAVFWVVRVTDAAGAPVDAVIALTVNRSPIPVHPAPGAGPGAGETRLPASANLVGLKVEAPGAFPVEQDFRFAPTPEAPSVTVVEPAHAGLRLIALTSRGPDVNVEVHVALSALRDAFTPVLKVASRPPKLVPPPPALSFPPRGHSSIPVVQATSIFVAGAGPGLGVLRHLHVKVTGSGRLFFAMRQTAPRLVAVWVPPGLDAGGEGPREIPFHVHIPEDTAEDVDEAVSWRTVDVVHRALYSERRLAYQHEAAGRRAVLVVPVADTGEGLGACGSAAGLARLLQDLAVWLARLLKCRWPERRIGRLAVSTSAGGFRALERIIASRDAPGAPPLSEVYVLGGSADPSAALAGDLLTWLEGDADRRLRVYHGAESAWEALGRSIGGEPRSVVLGDGSETVEVQGARASLVLIPAEAQARLAESEGRPPAAVVASLFASHALGLSGFAPL